MWICSPGLDSRLGRGYLDEGGSSCCEDECGTHFCDLVWSFLEDFCGDFK